MVLHCEIGSDRGQKHIQVYTRHFLSSLHHCCSCGKVGSLPPAHGQSDYPCGCGRVDRSSCLDACFLKSSQPSAVSAIVLPTMRQQRFTQRSIFPHVSTRRIPCRQGHPIEPERERDSQSHHSLQKCRKAPRGMAVDERHPIGSLVLSGISPNRGPRGMGYVWPRSIGVGANIERLPIVHRLPR